MAKIPQPKPRAICDHDGETWRVRPDGRLTWLRSEDHLQDPREFFAPERNNRFTLAPGPVTAINYRECHTCEGFGVVEREGFEWEDGWNGVGREWRKVATVTTSTCGECGGMGWLYDWGEVFPTLAAYLESVGIRGEVAA